jgi:uncharacterized protein HemX
LHRLGWRRTRKGKRLKIGGRQMRYGRSIVLVGMMLGLGTVQVLPGVVQSIEQTREQRKAEADSPRASEAEQLFKQGKRFYNQNSDSTLKRYQQALEKFQQALKIYTEISDRKGEIATLNFIGKC